MNKIVEGYQPVGSSELDLANPPIMETAQSRTLSEFDIVNKGIRGEIIRFASDKDIPILLWLFEKYHIESQWHFVARCIHQKYGKFSYQTNRIWKPTKEGYILYMHSIQ